MKPVSCLLFTAFLFFTIQAKASAQGKMSLGAGLAYGFSLEKAGIQANGAYAFNDKMRLGVDITYWLTDDVASHIDGESWSITYLESNANYNYIFYDEVRLLFYVIGTFGVHITYEKIDVVGYSGSEADIDIGVGVGTGVEYGLNSVKLYAEPRFFLNGFGQFALSAGLRIPF